MRTYIGTKIVKAEPMTRAEYNAFRKWDLPADEDGSDRGFLVEYLDGGGPNVPGREGYVSWSPADVFERSYVSLPPTDGLEPYQVRVVAERAELEDRLSKLVSFIGRPAFDDLPQDERARMVRQRRLMEQYAEVLGERVEAWS